MNRSLFFLFISVITCACHNHQLTTMHLKEKEYLLKKNKIRLLDNKDVDKAELGLYIRQKPNNSILFGVWKAGLQWKNIWYNPKKNKPRPAVILDTMSVERSVKQLDIYLQNLGYYNAEIVTKVRRTRILGVKAWETKKAIVDYEIRTGGAFFIDSSSSDIPDPTLNSIYKYYAKHSHLVKGKHMEKDRLEQERVRMTKDFQNKGYYDFTEKYIHFNVDTNLGDYRTTVSTIVKNPANEAGNHLRYYIRNIYVQTDYDAYQSNNLVSDTLTYKANVYFLSKGASKFKPGPIYKSIFIKPGGQYSIDKYKTTYKQLVSLQMFGLIDIDFEKISTKDSLNTKRELDVYIKLSPAKKMSVSAELMGTFREGFGANGQVAFSNKNPFGGSEIFEFSVSGGAEDLTTSTSDDKILGSNVGPRLSLRFPKFLFFPTLSDSISKSAFPKTKVSTMFNYQQRLDFTRYLSNVYLRYEWNEGRYKKHELNVLDFSFSFITKDSKILSELSNLSLSEQFRFEDNISSGIKYRFTYNNQLKPGVKHPMYLVAKGSLIGVSSLLGKASGLAKRNDNQAITLFDIRYSNFFKADVDYRYYLHFNQDNIVVFRAFSGAAFVLDDFSVVPFEQLYFSGGANSVRGWQQRTLGPGVFVDEDNFFDRLGEVKIEGNIEYRFPVTKVIKGAVFVDAGNVWNFRTAADPSNFELDKFYQQLAISPGLGLRLDFDFFLFRVDMAYPLKKPHLSTLSQFSNTIPNWNFGIGYPF